MRVDMRNKIEIWGNTPIENELEETDYKPDKLKTIWAAIVPQTGNLQKQQADTIMANVTHKIIVRYEASKDIAQDMWIIFRGNRFDIKFILNPYFKNETLELFCEQVIE